MYNFPEKGKWLCDKWKCFRPGKRFVITAPPALAASTFDKAIIMNGKSCGPFQININNQGLSEHGPIFRNFHMQASASCGQGTSQGGMAFLGSLLKEASFACNLPIRRTCVFFCMLSQQALQLKAKPRPNILPNNHVPGPFKCMRGTVLHILFFFLEAHVRPAVQLINLTTISTRDDYPTPLSEVLPDAFRPLLPGFLQNVSSLRMPTYGQQDRHPPRMCRVCSRY
jgi:hypothetical protein